MGVWFWSVPWWHWAFADQDDSASLATAHHHWVYQSMLLHIVLKNEIDHLCIAGWSGWWWYTPQHKCVRHTNLLLPTAPSDEKQLSWQQTWKDWSLNEFKCFFSCTHTLSTIKKKTKKNFQSSFLNSLILCSQWNFTSSDLIVFITVEKESNFSIFYVNLQLLFKKNLHRIEPMCEIRDGDLRFSPIICSTWKFIPNKKISKRKSTFENVICKMSTILFQPQRINSLWPNDRDLGQHWLR